VVSGAGSSVEGMNLTPQTEQLECLDGAGAGQDCAGPVECRHPLSGTGRSFPRCEMHWARRLDRQGEIDRRYPATPPRDWSPLDAGEAWDEDDY
jgi:hypothetical protein